VSREQASWALASLDVLRDLLSGRDKASAESGKSETGAAESLTIRVPMNRLDSGVRTVGELIILAGRIDANITRVAAQEVELQESCQSLHGLLGELQEQLIKMRLVPVGPLLQRIAQLGRETALRLGKSVEIVVEGADEEVDASLFEHLRDPLVHMIRNAVDHGMETPPQRRLAGKPEMGRVVLRAYRASGRARVELSDDGAGLNHARILEKARQVGLITDKDKPSNEAISDFIFRPGFSTAATIDDVSGRGVGLDVVRHNVERLNGRVSVSSVEGKSTRFEISIPMNLSVQRGFQVGVQGKIFVLPAEQVLECLPIPSQKARDSGGDTSAAFVAQVRGRATPCIDLRHYFDLNQPQSQNERAAAQWRPSLVVVDCEGIPVGLLVDHVYGEQRSVMRPLGPFFSALSDLAGAILLGDGSVGLLLNPDTIAKKIEATQIELRAVEAA
jgi:two-component system chemotaxis sensor kinase CheA